MDKYLFFATFSIEEDERYSISFCDLPGCYTFGENIEDGIKNAKEALELHLFGMEEDKDYIPEATSPIDIKVKENEFLVPIIVYMKPVREEMNSKAVKKTLTIPYWLNKVAEKEGINFSALLQKAIKEKIGIND